MQQAPLRNIVRAPRRSLVTTLGIAAALAALVAFVGMVDSFVATTERGDREILGDSPDRIEVSFAGFFPAEGDLARQVNASPLIGAAEPGLSFGGKLLANGTEIDAQVDLLNLESEIWRPSLIDGTYDRSKPGVYISELASRDLGASVGDMVELQHAHVEATGSVTIISSQLPVLGVHPHPFRFATYMDTNQASLFGTQGLMNRMAVVPAEGVSASEVKRALISVPGVASMESVGDIAEAIRDLLDQFVVVLQVVEVAMLLIALLIAFNAASINVDERTREHATMFAFGVPVGTVMRMTMVENLILGVCATATGVFGGWFLLRLIISTRVEDTMPDIYIKPFISETTLLISLLLGVVCVALAPLLMWRKLSRMDVPGSLKIAE
jgi:putative ABC transport system permease protein